MPRGERSFEQLLHLAIPTVASDIEQRVIHRQTQRIAAVIEQESHDFDPVLPDGKIERRAIDVVTSHDGWIRLDKTPYRFEIAGDRRAEHIPDVDAGAGGPRERLVLFQFF